MWFGNANCQVHKACEWKKRKCARIKGATRVDFEDVIKKLPLCNNQGNFRKHLQSLRKKGLIGHDDYSIAMF
jgi:hypothetical protein